MNYILIIVNDLGILYNNCVQNKNDRAKQNFYLENDQKNRVYNIETKFKILNASKKEDSVLLATYLILRSQVKKDE